MHVAGTGPFNGTVEVCKNVSCRYPPHPHPHPYAHPPPQQFMGAIVSKLMASMATCPHEVPHACGWHRALSWHG